MFSSREISERRIGRTFLLDEEEEVELKVSFDYRSWSEGRPYGSTTAYESMSEVGDMEFELAGVSCTREFLDKKFGEEAAEAAIDRAIENGE